MKRTLRQTSRIKRIIESSDSEDASDDNYIPDKKPLKAKQTRRKPREDDPPVGNANKKKKPIDLNSIQCKESTELDHVSEQNNINKGLAIKSTSRPPRRVKRKIESSDSEHVSEDDYISENKPVKAKQTKKRPREDDPSASNANKKKRPIDFNSMECKEWTELDYVSEQNNVSKRIAENVIKLFNNDHTIPFIARYRQNMTDGMDPDKLRAMKGSLDCAKSIKQRAATILKQIDKVGQLSSNVNAAIVSAKSLDDLEDIYSLFKPAAKHSLVEKAKELGLGVISEAVLQGRPLPSLSSLIAPDKDGLQTERQIKDGIVHVVADIINKDKTIFDRIKELQSTAIIRIEVTECKSSKSSKDQKEKDIYKKYERYYEFKTTTRHIKPHQILAVNRGVAQKILNIKLHLPDFFETQFKKCCCNLYWQATKASALHSEILHQSIDYAFTKFVKPLVVRRARNELKQKAEAASIEVFATNVKQLLLTPPVRGKVILGIDPGFAYGCKLAIISEHGNVLETNIIYPHNKEEKLRLQAADTFVNLVNKYKCTIVALGNGKACSETEMFLNKLIESKAFGSMDVSYTIVNECGSSIYSCSAEAKSEFPDLEARLISAISIARRLQDPLAELVKIDPQHLGVGMYQHDLPEKQLLAALNEVVSEAVSFVGVDVNTASLCLLKRVAGLNITRAKNIIQWRTECGTFKNRQQLLDVKGIGNKVFEQCSGFIRVLPETSTIDNNSTETKTSKKNSKKSQDTFNLLDQTWIHPESYSIAERFLEYCNCDLNHLGTERFIEKIKSTASEGYAVLAEKFSTNEATMEIIVKGLSMKKDEDIRLKNSGPLFRKGMLSMDDLSIDMVLTGVVQNVTHFGAFVDVGLDKSGLIPGNFLENSRLSVGQRVEVKITSIELARKRFLLALMNVL